MCLSSFNHTKAFCFLAIIRNNNMHIETQIETIESETEILQTSLNYTYFENGGLSSAFINFTTILVITCFNHRSRYLLKVLTPPT